ncbi:MAG: DMT family transporter [Betaproteobacteria bacterium]|nr:DMT family transporter [Betaproteobacteria bacterium]MDH5221375.1 DMT family transporter [Betaproteobacteria bacterium]MDH5352746.1 DMT family transporter [Betaproteobacteria bacterium]
MSAILSPRLGVPLLMLLATVFAGNHIAARLAFDHGASVPAAVAVRSGATALVMVALLLLQRVPMALPRATLARGLGIGVLVAMQSYCLYSAVAIIPVALALLAFNTCPLLLVLLTWAVDGVHPGRRALVAMPLALLGLVLALDIIGTLETMAGRWAEIGAGVAWALGAATTFALTLFLTTKHLKDVDGRMRTLLTMGTTAVIVGLAGGLAGNLALPTDGTGWLGLVLLTVLYGSAITAIFTVVPRLGAATNTTALNFEPIAALVLGWVVLGQEMAARQMLGALLVVAAVVLIGSRRH